MSTVVVVRKDGEAAIGADTLTSLGTIRESAAYVRNRSKILQAGQSYIATVGHASWGLVLSRYFSQHRQVPALDSRQAIFEEALRLHQTLKSEYFVNPDERDNDAFESSQLDCLIANPSGIYGLYSLRSVQEYSRFYAFGHGTKYALGAMKVAYELNLSAEAVARAGLEAAAEFDAFTQGPFDLFTMALAEE